MLRIWGRRNSINVQKVMWAVGELGLDHERIDAGGAFGGLDTDAFAALNPNRRVPVIEDDGLVLWESHAIVRYLATKYGLGALAPEDLGARARSDMWTDWAACDLQPAALGIFWNLYRTPEPQRNWQAIRWGVARSAKLLELVDHELETRDFLAGDRLTFGDIPVAVHFYRYFTLDIERPALPNVEAWYQRLQQREAYRTHVMVSYEDLKGQRNARP